LHALWVLFFQRDYSSYLDALAPELVGAEPDV
jgi:hypothetical protein